MIEEISIRDLGVIREAILPLGPGFTAITGETGAGKTMVITALGLLQGQRADSALVRSGSAHAIVDGRWIIGVDDPAVERVREAGGDLDPISKHTVELVLSRSVTAEGRSKAFAGGRAVPANVLAEVSNNLVVVHGQSDQARLRSVATHRDAVDRFAGPPLETVLTTYAHVFSRWRENTVTLHRLYTEQERRTNEAEELRNTLAEIETIAPQPGEDSLLSERAERLSNLEELRTAATQAREMISSDETEHTDVVTLLASARRNIERSITHDPALAVLAETLASAHFVTLDIAAQLSRYISSLDIDSIHELENIQQRRAELAALTRKYGPTIDDVLTYADTHSKRLFDLETDTETIETLITAVDADEQTISELAEELTALRTQAAYKLSAAITEELHALAMPDANVLVHVESGNDLTTTGRDQVSILLQPHAGSEPRPITKGASGGELSRVMLALEVVLASSNPVPTFIFDEVDAGVGGSAAIEIGRRLNKLAQTSQVIVVTHLAQVAAFATNHLVVVKDSTGSVTASSVRQLHGTERETEIARLLSGLAHSETGLAHARQLLEHMR